MREAEEHSLTRADTRELSYTYWKPASGDGKDHRAILLLYNEQKQQGWLQHVVEELNLPDFGILAWDARAHLLSSNGDASSADFSAFVRELDAFVRHLSGNHGINIEEMAVMAQGFECVLATAWIHDYAPRIRCLILAKPAFEIRERTKPASTSQSQVHPQSEDEIQGVDGASERIIADAQAIHTPLQLLVSRSDQPGHQQLQHEFFEHVGSEIKEKQVFDNFDGDTSGDRKGAFNEARNFLLKTFEKPSQRTFLLEADRSGHTKEEFEALCRPLPLFSSRRLSFAAAKLFMRTVGSLSDGIRLGLKTGFDSGSTLDYVYRNQPSGVTRLGKTIDESYLNSIGWRGIRIRRQNLQELVIRAARELQSEGQPVRVLDIAAGYGRYVLEAVTKLESKVEGILLRDYSELDVRQGRELIKEKGLEDIASFEQADAFDRASLAAIRPRPTLTIICGLYELFPDNSMINDSLAGLAEAMQPGGYLIYTGMPWHPEHEFISRALPSHRTGHRCVTRRRSQAELDELVANAGFFKTEQLIDEWGIFTVSAARRSS